MASILLDHGYEVNAFDKGVGESVLHTAVRFDLPEMVELLLEAGANPELVNDQGQTPIEYARDSKINAKKAERVLKEHKKGSQ
jgi:ankyrin repeat protein